MYQKNQYWKYYTKIKPKIPIILCKFFVQNACIFISICYNHYCKDEVNKPKRKGYKMTKTRFIAIQTKRGYKIQDFGKMVILRDGKYTAIWFFNEDGTLDETQKPSWKMERF